MYENYIITETGSNIYGVCLKTQFSINISNCALFCPKLLKLKECNLVVQRFQSLPFFCPKWLKIEGNMTLYSYESIIWPYNTDISKCTPFCPKWLKIEGIMTL